ncbi:hypothetical protein NKJ95_32180 [Mesorhizobium sp. M0012]|uniref:hypothetical protein n=1 Tax=Mesorhizobium sp. M0012 TaxID=2956840 RepID=UPI0033366619
MPEDTGGNQNEPATKASDDLSSTSAASEPQAAKASRADLKYFAELLKATIVSRWTYIFGFVGFLLISIFLVKPFDTPGELLEDNAAIAWNKAIERLGIQPLYPPQEDFFVGDVYITLDDPEGEIDGQLVRYPTNVYKGRGVKIGHIDMRESIKKGAQPFRFPETKIIEGKATADQLRSELPPETASDDLIRLSLVAFPGISVKHYINTGSEFWRFVAGRRSGEIEEISIPYAESYGAPVVDSLLALGKYCTDVATKELCNDEVARKILGYVLGNDVNAVHGSKYVFPISVTIVGQVFLARELKIRRYRGDSLSTHLNKGALTGEQLATALGDASSASPAGVSRPAIESPIIQSGDYENAQSTRVSLDQIFARPVAFGFRRVSFALPRSDPPAPNEGSK